MENASTDDRCDRIVHLVEDDRPVRDATARFLEAAGYDVRTYESGADFLSAAPDSGCAILDLQLPGANGLEIQEKLLETGEPLPVVFLSGRADIPDSVRAIKAGAVDFLTKSADAALLLDAVSRALAASAAQRAERERLRELRARYELLSPREREVFAHLISGQLNKQIGFDLGISLQTTKIHRHRVLAKMKADSIADLVRMAADLGIASVGHVR
jgi:FixJ family two-component response regulator